MTSNDTNEKRTVLSGPTSQSPGKMQQDSPESISTKKKPPKRKVATFTETAPVTPKWLRFSPLLAVLLPIISILLPLQAGIAVSALGAALGLFSAVKLGRDNERRWASIAGLVVGLLLIPVYILLLGRGVYSIIFPVA